MIKKEKFLIKTKKEREKMSKEQELMNEVMDDSYYLQAKGYYWTAYFWKLNLKYSAISDYNLDAFQSKVREQIKKYLAEKRGA
jgi:hypothetical protein|tara:strand:+ start:363 stop:611 length:249 start_codon:yes stop_codon:yes gene_type:complete